MSEQPEAAEYLACDHHWVHEHPAHCDILIRRCTTCGHIDGEAVNAEIQLSLRDAWIAGFVAAKMGADVHQDNPYPREQRGGEPA